MKVIFGFICLFAVSAAKPAKGIKSWEDWIPSVEIDTSVNGERLTKGEIKIFEKGVQLAGRVYPGPVFELEGSALGVKVGGNTGGKIYAGIDESALSLEVDYNVLNKKLDYSAGVNVGPLKAKVDGNKKGINDYSAEVKLTGYADAKINGKPPSSSIAFNANAGFGFNRKGIVKRNQIVHDIFHLNGLANAEVSLNNKKRGSIKGTLWLGPVGGQIAYGGNKRHFSYMGMLSLGHLRGNVKVDPTQKSQEYNVVGEYDGFHAEFHANQNGFVDTSARLNKFGANVHAGFNKNKIFRFGGSYEKDGYGIHVEANTNGKYDIGIVLNDKTFNFPLLHYL